MITQADFDEGDWNIDEWTVTCHPIPDATNGAMILIAVHKNPTDDPWDQPAYAIDPLRMPTAQSRMVPNWHRINGGPYWVQQFFTSMFLTTRMVEPDMTLEEIHKAQELMERS